MLILPFVGINFAISQEYTSTNKEEFLSYIQQQDIYYQSLIDQNNGSTEGINGYKSYMRWKTTYSEEAYNSNGMYYVLSGENRDVLYVTKIKNNDSVSEVYFQIWKTNNCRDAANDVEWTNVTPVFNGDTLRKWCGDIAIDGNNTNRFWASYAGYNDKKIIYFDGSNWQDLTNDPNNTLDGLIVTQVEWVDSLDNMLLLGTNCGVYYKTDNMPNWAKLEGIPNVRIKEIVLQPEINKFLVATRGRGLWRGSLPCIPESSDLYISTNTNWNTNNLIGGNVIVQSGARLTISGCEIQFAPDKKIIIKQGAELFIDNATLDSRCSELWGGIEVWGNSNLPQSPSSNQGAVRTYMIPSNHWTKNLFC